MLEVPKLLTLRRFLFIIFQLLTNQAAAEANVSVTSSVTGSDTVDAATVIASINALENKVNALLAKIRTHGLIAT